jgi:hypothetical protein
MSKLSNLAQVLKKVARDEQEIINGGFGPKLFCRTPSYCFALNIPNGQPCVTNSYVVTDPNSTCIHGTPWNGNTPSGALICSGLGAPYGGVTWSSGFSQVGSNPSCGC